jgi:hypothetical protein
MSVSLNVLSFWQVDVLRRSMSISFSAYCTVTVSRDGERQKYAVG